MNTKKAVSIISSLPASESQDDSANRPQLVQPVNRITATRPRPDKPGPTAPLRNGTYERFAQQIAGGRSAAEAYRACGYRGKGKSQSASRLLRRPEVAARVESLRMDVSRQVVSQVAVDAGWVVDTLVQVINQAMQKCEFGAATQALNVLGKNMGMFQMKPGEMAQQENLAERLTNGRRRVLAHDKEMKVIREQEAEQEARRSVEERRASRNAEDSQVRT